ncbi:hypothetical protein [Flavivirga spongiicola]|uniref:Carboxypeptidase-like regulatory domain-containing protein n=1 Tax=Flavivirga spongiicola TaxID=421621 RepID=A0ABU7XMV0_9FLAO|nr:hypothetical protein [Flavivirga sp. MEBiC05379]MDO5981515.1 hypothetical protein [Flavivirga sp. MEBiC05379]MDO5981917.1 hypothetical protein [Flavivirga sp. MEBiC05379]
MKYFIFILLPFSIFSQNITGKVYDSDTTVKGIDVFNLSKKTRTYTDNYGSFTIQANMGDTLSFHSIFHNKKIIKLTKSHFNGIMVIELRKTINRLNEILIQNNIKPKAFNPSKEKAGLKEQIAKDIKSNPHLYGTSSKYGLDVVRVIGLIGKLFKKKGKNVSIVPISHKALDSLFSNSPFFNDELLTNNLTIPKDRKQLFFEYCETKNLDKELLKNESEIILLDSLVNYSNSFLKIIEASKKK